MHDTIYKHLRIAYGHTEQNTLLRDLVQMAIIETIADMDRTKDQAPDDSDLIVRTAAQKA